MKNKPTDWDDAPRSAVSRLLKLCATGCLAALLWGGCKNEKVAGQPDPVGTYALVSVDGKSVPCTLQHEGHTMTINSGQFIINPDGSCRSQITLAGAPSPIDVQATYAQDGAKLTMKWKGAGMTVGTIQGPGFTMNNEGMVFAYRK